MRVLWGLSIFAVAAWASDDPNPREDGQQGQPFSAANEQTYDTLETPQGDNPQEPGLQKKAGPYQTPFPSGPATDAGQAAPTLGYNPAGRRVVIAPPPLEVDAPA